MLVQQADFYLALPAVSRSIDGILTRTHNLKDYIPTECVSFLSLACKLKSKLLFKECIIFLCNPYSDPKLSKLQDPKLKAIATVAHTNIISKMNKFLMRLMEIIAEDEISSG